MQRLRGREPHGLESKNSEGKREQGGRDRSSERQRGLLTWDFVSQVKVSGQRSVMFRIMF